MAQGIREILDSREREVRRSIEDIRTKQLAPLERELAEIIAARKAIGEIKSESDPFEQLFGETENDRFMRMTYEQLAEKALSDHFSNGATIKELLLFIRKEYGREISQGSFSPVLSRMRSKETVKKLGKVWVLRSSSAFEPHNG